MRILVVLGHPNPRSFNHALAHRCVDTLRRAGNEVIFHDLHVEGFPVEMPTEELDKACELPDVIQQHCDELQQAEGIVIVHPNWWGQPPALLKGWIDRVFRPDVAYRFLEGDDGEGIPEGLLKARFAVVLNTSNTPADREDNLFGDPLERLWKTCILEFCGVESFYRRMFRIVCLSTLEKREQWLDEAAELVLRAVAEAQPPYAEAFPKEVDG